MQKIKKKGKEDIQGLEGGREVEGMLYVREEKMRELTDKMKEETKEKIWEEVKKTRTQTEIWKFINKQKKKGKETETQIMKKIWINYFITELEGHRQRTVGIGREEGVVEEEEQEITDEEIEKQLRELKKGKAAGIDGI